MKVEVKENKQVKELPFPKLMISERLGQIILAHGVNEDNGCLMGILIESNGFSIGEDTYSKNWHAEPFKEFHGSIKLSND